jgi:hypothetical protein
MNCIIIIYDVHKHGGLVVKFIAILAVFFREVETINYMKYRYSEVNNLFRSPQLFVCQILHSHKILLLTRLLTKLYLGGV